MSALVDSAAEQRLAEYVDGIGRILGNRNQRAAFAVYSMGLLGDGERKSQEPIAARACGDPAKVHAMQARLGRFLNDAEWNNASVRSYGVHYALREMTRHGPVRHAIIDDTGMLKQGSHSVGVQRQYTGSAGKVTNCQVAVTLTIATEHAHVPIDAELYLPESWTNDPKRRAEARIPDDVIFRTKLDLALQMIRRAIEEKIPLGIVLVDAAYGNSGGFRSELQQLGVPYGVAIQGSTKVWQLDRQERIRGVAVSACDLGQKLKAQKNKFRRTTWREGTGSPLSARFAAVRVASAHDDPLVEPKHREAQWLFIEWPDNEAEPCKYHLCNLPKTTSRKKLIRSIKERYRTERGYQDLKGQLGFDHFEGRRWPGWHHHISVVLCCFAFVVAEQARRFPPSTRRAEVPQTLDLAA